MDFGDIPWRGISTASFILSATIVGFEGKLKLAGVFTALLILGVLSWLAWRMFIYPNFFSPFRDLPEPPRISIWNGQHKVITTKPAGRTYRDWVNSIPNDGLIRFLNMGNQERLLVTSSKVLAEMMVARNYDFEKPPVVRFAVGRILGDGLLVSEGADHKMQRRALAPAFTTKQVKALYSTFWLKAVEGAEAIAESSRKNRTIDIGEWAARVTLDIVGVASLGRDFGAMHDPENPLVQTYEHVFGPGVDRATLTLATMLLPRWAVPYLPLEANRVMMEGAATIRRYSHDLIHDKREKITQGSASEDDLLGVMLGSGLTDELIVDQIMTFLAAGHETTASSVTWSIYLLSKHQEAQEKLRKEVRSKITSAGNVTNADIENNMPYLNAFISEVLRMYPPVPIILREAVVDTTLLGRRIPKGTRLIVSQGATNWDKEQWGPDAGEFRPERWLEDSELGTAANGGASSKYAYLTFLHGQRNCIGQGFARGEIACILAAWVGRLRFELHNEADADDANIVLKKDVLTVQPEHGPMIDVTILDGW